MEKIATKTMKAAVNTAYGTTDVLHFKEVETPIPKATEVLIHIHATTVNRTDCGFLVAEYFLVRLFWGLFKPKKTILGTEFAGKIVAIGKDVQTFKIGDAVFGLSADDFGAHAEYLCMSENGSVALKPQNIDYQQAAAICEGAYLAMVALEPFLITFSAIVRQRTGVDLALKVILRRSLKLVK